MAALETFIKLVANLEQRVVTLESQVQTLIIEVSTDYVTGALNHRGFERVSRSWDGIPLTVIMVSIDDFKTTMSYLGRDLGDVMLKSFANMLSQGLPPNSIVCRWSEDEFTVLMPFSGLETATAIIHRWRNTPFMAHIAPTMQRTITFSAGLAMQGVGGLVTLTTKIANESLINSKINATTQRALRRLETTSATVGHESSTEK